MTAASSKGEVKNAEADKIFFGKAIPKDTAAPFVGFVDAQHQDGQVRVRVRVHDRKSPCMPHDWKKVELLVQHDGKERRMPLAWYGEYLWRADVDAARLADLTLVVEATDAAGNVARSLPKSVRVH